MIALLYSRVLLSYDKVRYCRESCYNYYTVTFITFSSGPRFYDLSISPLAGSGVMAKSMLTPWRLT